VGGNVRYRTQKAETSPPETFFRDGFVLCESLAVSFSFSVLTSLILSADN